MATVTFTGDPNSPGTDPSEAEFFGIVFPFGEPVEVPDDVFKKLDRHSHFNGEIKKPERPAGKAKK